MDDRNPAGAGCARLYADRRRQGAEDQRSKTRIPPDPWARSRPPGGALSSAALRTAVAAKNGAGQQGQELPADWMPRRGCLERLSTGPLAPIEFLGSTAAITIF
jgi:hypothetical protein